MRPPYSEYAAPPVYVYPQPPTRGVRFSRTELVQLGIAILALSAALTIANVSPLYGGLAGNSLADLGLLFLAGLVSVGTGVGLHEIMHKIVAQRYGLWAEFRYSPRGLLMTFVLAFAGFVFGAPGATYISGSVTPEQNGRISAAGPVTNLVLALSFLGLELALLPIAYIGTAAAVAAGICFWAASINLILAGFNMIPIMPLDGAKVWHWNKGVWIGILALVLLILGTGSYLGYLFL
jgi:Zn-dependent protease